MDFVLIEPLKDKVEISTVKLGDDLYIDNRNRKYLNPQCLNDWTVSGLIERGWQKYPLTSEEKSRIHNIEGILGMLWGDESDSNKLERKLA